MKEHLFVSDSDGALYDTRITHWAQFAPLRATFRRSFHNIRTTAQFKATLRAGSYAWPGGYPMYLVTSDGAAICYHCAGTRELRNILSAIADKRNDGFRVIGCDINWEDGVLTCDCYDKRIESAYAD